MKFSHLAVAGFTVAAASTASAQREPVFTEGQFRLDLQKYAPQGHGILELKTPYDRGGVLVLELDDHTRAEFRDDGREMDQRADDGTFTAVVPADISRERQIFQRSVSYLERDVPISVFDGRERVNRVRSSQFLKKTKPGVMSLLTAGASNVVDADLSLFITDVDVLNDPEFGYNPCTHEGNLDGAWSFAHVWSELAGDADPSEFAKAWLNTWDTTQTVNGHDAPPRSINRDRIYEAWDTDEFGFANDVLDLEDAPFHAIAITNRIDLRNTAGYGSGNAGEARIIFSFVDDNCDAGVEGFLVIFEYAINKSGCAVKEWGQTWADLSDYNTALPGELADYQSDLAAITEQFTDLTSNPNANRLGQLRTNELQDLSDPWQMREFVLNDDGILEPVTVKLTPMTGFNQTPLIAEMVNTMDPLLFADSIGPISDLAFNPLNFFWTDTTNPSLTEILDLDARHEFSLNTCNGCHGGETMTFFTHVTWAPPGTTAPLSGFVTGINVVDPMDPFTVRTFDEKDRRRQDLQDLIDNSCFSGLLHKSALGVH